MAKRGRIYLDTSVFGALYDAEDPKRISIVESLLKKIRNGDYEAFVSRLTLQEVIKAPENIKKGLTNTIRDLDLAVLEENEESFELAELFLTEDVIPQKFRDDARHIAIAIFYNLDVLVSWNYRHMVNIRVKKMINSLCIRQGFKPIDIVSPEEVIEYEETES